MSRAKRSRSSARSASNVLDSGETIVAEIQFRKVAVQMAFAAMLEDATHASLEDGNVPSILMV